LPRLKALALALWLGLGTVSGALVLAVPSSDLAWALEKDAHRWTDIVADAVAATSLPDSVPGDISTFCPAYVSTPKPGRIHFWVGLVAAIARSESRFNQRDSFTESFRESGPESPFVVSRGLMQLSFPGDRDNYQCNLPSAESLYDPTVNLRCGVKILAQLVARDHRIAGQVDSAWAGGAVYWATLRSNGGKHGSNARHLAEIEGATRALAVCRVP